MTSLGAPAIGAQLVGRDGTLAALGQLYDATIGGCAQMVLLAGDAGIGKSRVVEEFGDHARLRGDIVATGVCVPANGGLPYAPLVGLLRQLEPGETLVADVAERFAESIDVRSLGAFAQTIFCESVLKLLTELSRRAPVVLVIEDLQWIDSASSLVIDFLARNLGDSRVLILATYRAEDLGRGDWLSSWLVELSRHPRVSEIELGPLSRVEIASLVSTLVDQRPAPALVEAVWTRSQGNPFFAEELAAGGGGPSLPAVLQGVVNARINRLSAPAQRLIRIAATIGLVIDHELLTAVDGSGHEVVDSAVRECIDQKVLVVEGESYRFRQALVQESVYGELLPGERTRRHRAIATILAADQQSRTVPATGRFGELAAHWWAAHEWGAAVEPSLRAADVAASALAYREAIVHLEHVLLAYDRVPDSIGGYLSRAELLEKAADVAFQAGDSTRAVELARAAIEAVEAELDPAARARCYTLLGRNLWGVGDSEAAFAAYRHAAAVIADAPPSPELAGLLAEEARGHLLMSLNSRGEQLARQALEVARAVGARRFEGHALNTLSCCRSGLGYYDEAVELMHEALVIAEEVSNPDDLNRAYGNLSALLLDHGLLDEAASIMFDGAAVGEDLWGVRLNGASGNGVEALVRLGRYAEAQDVLAQLGAHALGICAQSPWTLPAPIMIRTGRFAAAEDTLAIAWQMSSELQDVQQAGGILALGAELELERGRPTVADERLVQALALVARSEDETLLPELSMWIARAAADLHEQVRAPASAIESVARRQRVDDVIARVEEIVRVRAARAVSATPRTLAALAQAVAERSRLDQSDPDLWYRAAQLWVDAHETYPQAYCRWREAEALLEGRIGRARAIDGLNHAWLLARELGAAPLADRITQLAQRARLELFDPAGADPAGAGPAGDASAGAELGLTRREVEVLGQLAGGRSDRDIAEALFISRKTVGVHVSNVLRKLAVTNRIEAGKVGQAHGLPAAPARR